MTQTHPMGAREALENEIERLIGILDAMEPDPDLEPDLGWNPYLRTHGGKAADLEGGDDDLEPCCEDEGAQCDDEGATDNEDACAFADDLGTGASSRAERDRVTDSVVAMNDRLRALMVKRGLSPVPPLRNLEGSLWGR